MANNLTDFLEIKLLELSLGKTAYSKPTTYVALLTASAGETGDLTNEVGAGKGYSRQALTVDAAAAGATQNSGILDFGPATADWGTVAHWAVMDGPTIGAGNALWYGPFSVSKVVGSGDDFKIAAGALAFSMD